MLPLPYLDPIASRQTDCPRCGPLKLMCDRFSNSTGLVSLTVRCPDCGLMVYRWHGDHVELP